MKFSEIVAKLGTDAERNSLTANPECNPEITGVSAVYDATLNTISHIEGDKYAREISTTAASALILPMQETWQVQAQARNIAWIATSNPRLVFAKAITLFYQPFRPAPEIHPSAVIHPSAEIGKNVSIGARVVIQAGVKIGEQVCIHPNVVLYPGVEIGDRTLLHANCTIHEHTRIGKDCVIHSGAVIGAEGFGFVGTRTGWYKMEQSGDTILEDGVEIGCNSTVDRPAVGVTRIGRNTKFDNLVHVGHNGHIGSNCAFAGQVALAGCVTVGDQVLLAGQVIIANRTHIGDGAIGTAKACIYGDVPPKGIVTGYPAISHKAFLRAAALFPRLPEMYKTLKQLQRQLSERT